MHDSATWFKRSLSAHSFAAVHTGISIYALQQIKVSLTDEAQLYYTGTY